VIQSEYTHTKRAAKHWKIKEDRAMTKAEINGIIRDTARAYGFEASDEPGTVTGLTEIRSEELNFTIITFMTKNTDWEARFIEERIEVSASVSKMGGSPSPEELMKTAEEIRRGAELVEKLQSMDLTYTETF
jgi:hypothetical protein